MSYCPYESMKQNSYRAEQPNSYIRVLHASPNAPAVDVYANGNPIVTNLSYKELSNYIPVLPGNYNIKVYPAGSTTNPVVNTNVYIPPNSIFNVAAIGKIPNISLYTIPEPTSAQNFGRACVRFIHLSPTAPKVDVALSTGVKVFNNVGFKDITDYACIPAGTYSFNVIPTGTNNIALSIPEVQLSPNTYYTIYALGDPTGGSNPLEAILVTEPR
jgi:hypothetical protein